MDDSKFLKFRLWINQPKVVLTLTVCFLLIVNVFFLVWKTLPDYIERRNARAHFAEVREVLKNVESYSGAKHVTDESIQKLLAEIPLSLPTDHVIMRINGFAEETGILVNSFKQDDGEVESGGLEQAIAQFSGSSQALSLNEPQVGNEPEAEPQAAFGENIEEFLFTIEAVGEMSGLLNFFDLIAANTHVTSVQHWGIFELTAEEARKIPDLDTTRNYYKLNITFAMYTMPGYANVFGNPERKDTSIDQVLNDLQLKYPDIKPFQSVRKDKEEK